MRVRLPSILPVRCVVLLHAHLRGSRAQLRPPHRLPISQMTFKKKKKRSNNQEVDENKARKVRFGSVRLATRRKSSSGAVFTRTWSTSVDLLRWSETSLKCRRPGAPSIIGARVCACVCVRVCENSSKLCVCGKERGGEKRGTGRERISSSPPGKKMMTRQARSELLGTPRCAQE